MSFNIIEDIVRYGSVILSLIVFCFSVFMFIFNGIKKHAKKLKCEEENENLQEKLDDKNAVYKLVNEIIPLAIKKAEELPLISGKTKKLLAMSEILLNCNANDIDFELYKDFISEQIENLIEFSKTINKRKE